MDKMEVINKCSLGLAVLLELEFKEINNATRFHFDCFSQTKTANVGGALVLGIPNSKQE